MNKIYCALIILLGNITFAQEYFPTIHQEQQEYYNAQEKSTEWYENNVNTEIYDFGSSRSETCELNKVVYGWHPYWAGGAYLNYDWDLLSHLSFFSYEVDEDNGEALTTHGWATADAVDSALANGVKTTLCVTLFGGSKLSTFLTDATAKQTLIDNLIDLVSDRGAHGVNIDFEGLPSSQKTNFANFMVDLCDQMHTEIPGSEVSTVLYAVDWSNVFDFDIMADAVDHFIVMGYAYYYQGSSTTGPCDPLYHFGSSYNYTLSKTITYYLDKGCPMDKLVMGLPYYGYQWPTSSLTVPSSTTGSGIARTYAQVKTNSSGYYVPSNHTWDADSYTDIYAFNDGANKQCFITLEEGFRKRLEHINTTGIAGIGIWALGYDNGYDELWNAINDYLTDCYSSPCTGEIHDFGGPSKNHYNDESYTWTIAPTDADELAVDFTMFDVEVGYDTLFIYDGASTSAPLIGAYTGSSSPGTFNTSDGSLTFYWKSDGATVAPGFNANYECFIYNPVASFSAPIEPELCEISPEITFTNSSSDATSYYWEFPGGSPSTSTDTDPIITYTSTGTYDVILYAIDGTDSSMTTSSIDVSVNNIPEALYTSSSPAYIPMTQIFFTNTSSDATSYFWDFGDGNTSTDTDPWNDYGSTGDYLVQLIAMNPGCPNDTTLNTVQVIDNLGIQGTSAPEFHIFPNPFAESITINSSGYNGDLDITIISSEGQIVREKKFIADETIFIDNLDELAPGTYFVRIKAVETEKVYPLIKK